MKIIVIGSRAYNELVGRIEKIEAAIASLPEKGRAWNKEYIYKRRMDGRRAGLPLPGHQRAYPSTPPLGSRDHLFGHQPEAVLFPHGNPPCAEGAFRAAQKPTKGVGHVSG